MQVKNIFLTITLTFLQVASMQGSGEQKINLHPILETDNFDEALSLIKNQQADINSLSYLSKMTPLHVVTVKTISCMQIKALEDKYQCKIHEPLQIDKSKEVMQALIDAGASPKIKSDTFYKDNVLQMLQRVITESKNAPMEEGEEDAFEELFNKKIIKREQFDLQAHRKAIKRIVRDLHSSIKYQYLMKLQDKKANKHKLNISK